MVLKLVGGGRGVTTAAKLLIKYVVTQRVVLSLYIIT